LVLGELQVHGVVSFAAIVPSPTIRIPGAGRKAAALTSMRGPGYILKSRVLSPTCHCEERREAAEGDAATA
jgi:hypothetical protein